MTTLTRVNHSAIHRQHLHRFYAVDGGSGAQLTDALTGQSPYLQSVSTPRHADLLVIVTPVSKKLLPALTEIVQALPRPAHVLLIEQTPENEQHVPPLENERVELTALFPGARRVTSSSVEDVLSTIMNPAPWPTLALQNGTQPQEDTIQLPPKEEQEMATELAVLSLGPVQPYTAGPLRVLLVCDGEQVFSAQVESGYAQRDIAQAMLQENWQQGLMLARSFDPLAPVLGQLLYVEAIEQLQHWHPAPSLAALREDALALERVRNYLWWFVRFACLLDDAWLTDRAFKLARAFEAANRQVWRISPTVWIEPQRQGTVESNASILTQLSQIAGDSERLSQSIGRNRWLMLRTRNIGVLDAAFLREHDVSGPVLEGSEQGHGDVQRRLFIRVRRATQDIHTASNILSQQPSLPAHEANWQVPAGESHATVEGPRGQVHIHLKSDGGQKPLRVGWQSASAALLPLLPEMLTNQILGDAEIMLASLDIAMAEVDG